MAEDVARAVGAVDPSLILIDGIECHPRALGVHELTRVERACLKMYKREYLETFAENADLLGEKANDILLQKVEEASKWDITDLPVKYTHDTSDIKVTGDLIDWLKTNLGYTPEKKSELQDRLVRGMASSAMDSGMLSDEMLFKFTGSRAKKAKVSYVGWWITGCFAGMLELVWTAFEGQGVTHAQVSQYMNKNPSILTSLARDIEHMSAPSASNG